MHCSFVVLLLWFNIEWYSALRHVPSSGGKWWGVPVTFRLRPFVTAASTHLGALPQISPNEEAVCHLGSLILRLASFGL